MSLTKHALEESEEYYNLALKALIDIGEIKYLPIDNRYTQMYKNDDIIAEVFHKCEYLKNKDIDREKFKKIIEEILSQIVD